MIRATTRVQLMVFVLITLLGVTYVGASYIGINPLKRPYTVYLNLPNAGGIFTHADVAERGVVIGKVGAITIQPDHTGVVVALNIDHGVKIPSTGLTASVASLSAVGEQYIELEPKIRSAPYLEAGQSILPAGQLGQVPTSDAAILLNLKRLLSSVNVKQLSTVVNELGKGFAGLAPSLQSLIDNGNSLTTSAVAALPATLRLIDDGRTVLTTQNDVSAELKSFARSFAALTGEISGKDPALRGVIDNGALASTQLNALLTGIAPVLPTLLNNLNTFTGILDVRLPQTRAVLELFPSVVGDAFYALPKPGVGGVASARFGLVTALGAWCKAGYESTKTRSNLANAWGGAANLDAYCHGNNASLDNQGIDIRGARNTPRPAGDHANVTNSDSYPGPHYGEPFPGSGPVGPCGTPKCPTSVQGSSHVRTAAAAGGDSAVIPVPYDPTTGVVQGLDGKRYQLGLNGPVEPAFGSSSYTWLLIAPTMR